MLNSGFVANSSGNGADAVKAEGQTLRFGVFELDLRAGELRRSGMKIKLQEQPLQVLTQLLQKPGDVVTREEMRDHLWPSDTFVDFDHSLNAAIKRLRDALGDSADNPTFVETVARRGYRFLAPVSVVPTNGNGHGVVIPISTQPAKQRSAWKHSWSVGVGIAAIILVLLGIWLGIQFGKEKPRELKTTRLTATPADDWVRVSAISRDGKYLAYADHSGFYVQQIDTSETRPIALPSGFVVQSGNWMPDSVHLIVSLDRGLIKDDVPANPPNQSSRWGIWEISVLGGDPRPLSDFGRMPTPSPDGKKVAFIRSAGKNEEIWLMSADGSSPHRVLGDPGDWFGVLAWSPDGTAIAYTKGRMAMGGWGTNGSLEIVHLDGLKDGLQSETVIASTALCAPLVWGVDGRLIFTQGEPAPNQSDSNLWWLELNHAKPIGTPHRLTLDTGWINAISLSADKKRLAVLRQFQQPEIYLTQVEAGNKVDNPQLLTLDDRGDLPYAWTPDSQQIIFMSKRTGPYSIFRQDIHQTIPEMVVSGAPAAQLPRLTPDGKSVLYLVHPMAGQTPGNVSLMRVSLWGGSSTLVLASPNLGNHQCAQSPSKVCLYNEAGEDGIIFWNFDPVKGKGDRVLSEKVIEQHSNWSLSADGSMLAVVQRKKTDSTPEIRFFNLSTSTSEEQQFPMTDCLGIPTVDWAPDGKSAWSVCRSSVDEKFVLMNIDRQGRMHQAWKPDWPEMSSAIPSPDGKYLAISKATGTANVWMLEHF
jgi:Tol biopolymer transport system component/DNA-binding winged helix-turn-helix (wHTH) protein